MYQCCTCYLLLKIIQYMVFHKKLSNSAFANVTGFYGL